MTWQSVVSTMRAAAIAWLAVSPYAHGAQYVSIVAGNTIFTFGLP